MPIIEAWSAYLKHQIQVTPVYFSKSLPNTIPVTTGTI